LYSGYLVQEEHFSQEWYQPKVSQYTLQTNAVIHGNL